ncbi:hypothetical protein C8Q77DRAFT_248865 [Trametes polyzona]|nr:hypothetical protein C8Q77DRAFT_248865 [Trametes polyzona]
MPSDQRLNASSLPHFRHDLSTGQPRCELALLAETTNAQSLLVLQLHAPQHILESLHTTSQYSAPDSGYLSCAMDSLRPRLHYDILLQVLETCSLADGSRLMRTSRFFYTHGVVPLLSHRVIQIPEEEGKLQKFLAFLRVEGDRRYKLVRRLHLHTQPYEPEPSDYLGLVEALRCLTNLWELEILYSEDILSAHPDLPAVLAALSSLKTLSLLYMGERAITLVQTVHAELSSVDLSFGDHQGNPVVLTDIDPSRRTLLHPISLLERFKSSLEEISGSYWFMGPGWYDYPHLGNFVYPKVRRIQFDDGHELHLQATALMSAFPNLTHLKLKLYEEGSIPTAGEVEQYAIKCRRNCEAQQDQHYGWTELEEYEGGLADLYALGLLCPITTVTLVSEFESLAHTLGRVLALARPRRLRLEWWPFTQQTGEHQAFSFLKGQASQRLQSLSINARWHPRMDKEFDISAALESLLSAAPYVKLSTLRLTLSIESHESVELPWTPHDGKHSRPLSLAETSAESFDLRDYVRRFLAVTPSLNKVYIDMTGPGILQRKATFSAGELYFEDSRLNCEANAYTIPSTMHYVQ